jgi:hypothetical protein
MKKSILFSLAILALVFGAASCLPLDTTAEEADIGDPCGGEIDCTPGSICWNDICIEEGALRFSLVWETSNDLDLHVMTPDGTEIFYGNSSAAGGELDVDDCVGGGCTNPDGMHVENIFFAEEGASGTYTYWVVNYSGDEESDFELEVAEGEDVVATESGTVDSTTTTSTQYTYDY